MSCQISKKTSLDIWKTLYNCHFKKISSLKKFFWTQNMQTSRPCGEFFSKIRKFPAIKRKIFKTLFLDRKQLFGNPKYRLDLNAASLFSKAEKNFAQTLKKLPNCEFISTNVKHQNFPKAQTLQFLQTFCLILSKGRNFHARNP